MKVVNGSKPLLRIRRSIFFQGDYKTSYPVMISSSFVRVVKGEELDKQLRPQLIPESLPEIMVTFYNSNHGSDVIMKFPRSK